MIFLIIGVHRINLDDIASYSDYLDRETRFKTKSGQEFYLDVPVKKVDECIMKYTKHVVMEIKGEENGL